MYMICCQERFNFASLFLSDESYRKDIYKWANLELVDLFEQQIQIDGKNAYKVRSRMSIDDKRA